MNYQRVVITRYGGPDVLKVVVEEKLPTPQNGQVRIKVLATSVCFTDTMIRQGKYFGVKEKVPFSPGYDVVGVVDELGTGVTDLRVGQRVATLTVTGAYSEYMCVSSADCVPVPDGVDAADAVSLVLTYVTAYQMLQRFARVKPGHRILVHGASGAVGTALVQLGALQGLEIYGTASKSSQELVASLGAIPLDYESQDFVERIANLTPPSVDAVFDGIGGSNFNRSLRCVRQGGVMVAFGSYNASIGKEKGGFLSYFELMIRSKLAGKSVEIYSIVPLKEKHPDWFRADLGELLNLLAQGKIKPVIAKKFPLAQAAEAHRILEARGVRGKIVLVTQADGK